MKRPEERSRAPKKVPARARQGDAYHHGDLRQALIEAARALLEQGGLEALGLRAAARQAGVSQAAPYHHFADKAALLAAVAAEGFRELTRAMVLRRDLETRPLPRLTATGIGYVAFATANPALFRLMFGGPGLNLSSDPALGPAAAAAYEVLREATLKVVAAAGRDPADAMLVSLSAWSLVHGLAKLIIEAEVDPLSYGTATPEALARLVLGRMIL